MTFPSSKRSVYSSRYKRVFGRACIDNLYGRDVRDVPREELRLAARRLQSKAGESPSARYYGCPVWRSGGAILRASSHLTTTHPFSHVLLPQHPI